MAENEYIPYNIISEESFGEYEEKKSKFLCYLYYVENEEDALLKIAAIKKKHYDARHNCYAYILGPTDNVSRSSDDGEPSGTAGKPILEVLTGANLKNVLAVVTRYFGGVLLGTGGLVRAYTEATKDALQNTGIKTMSFCQDFQVMTEYSEINNIQFFVQQNSISTINTEYTDKVVFTLRVKAELYSDCIKGLTELTRGQALITEIDTGFFPI